MFSFRNTRWSHGDRTDDYVGCTKNGTRFLANDRFTEIVMWEGALS